MNDSILYTIKKLLGYEEDYRPFDTDIIIFINNALMILEQLGVGRDGFAISGEMETWDDYLSNMSRLESVKTYIYLKVRLAHDPPQNSYLISLLENQAKELEWRLNVKAEQIAE